MGGPGSGRRPGGAGKMSASLKASKVRVKNTINIVKQSGMSRQQIMSRIYKKTRRR